ncbi:MULTISPECIES: hypothetical protein [unclassified Microcoleus]|uniref:hypothetical protein n=1 Tax=unclassified Microcoleus TaxID=2642155 RepID=UPI002FD66E99
MSRRNDEIKGIFLGILLLIGLHVAAFILGSIIGYVSVAIGGIGSSIASFLLLSIFGIGLVQIIYVIPAIIILSRQRQFAVMKGVIIGAVITALLNGGCWLLFASFWRGGF